MRRGEKGRIGFVVGFVRLAIGFFAIAQMRNDLVIRVQNGHAACEVGDKHLPIMLIKAAGIAHDARQGALVIKFEIKYLEAVIMAIRDVNFRLVLERAYPHAVTGAELAVFLAAAADGFEGLPILIKARDALAAVAIDDVNVAVRRNRDIGGVRPIEWLGSGAFLHAAPNLIKNLAVQVSLINAC